MTLPQWTSVLVALAAVGCGPRVDNDIRPEVAAEGVAVEAEGAQRDLLRGLGAVSIPRYRAMMVPVTGGDTTGAVAGAVADAVEKLLRRPRPGVPPCAPQ